MADFKWWPTPVIDGWGVKYSMGRPGYAWAREVPTLSAANIRQDGSIGEGDCRCLLGWAAGFSFSACRKIRQTIADIIEERTRGRNFPNFGHRNIPDFNDGCANPQEVADVWNEAVRRRGYTEAA